MIYSMALDPSSNSTIHMKLFRNVKNVSDLQKLIIKGALNCCLIKPSLIIDPLQIVVAANKAIVAESYTTKSIYTEILFNLSISKNITQSLRKFGIDITENNVLCVVIGSSGDLDAVAKEIDGEEVDILVLDELKNETEIKKTYKLTGVEIQKLPLLDSIISKIATKDFL